MQDEVWGFFQRIPNDTNGATCEVSCNICDRRFLFDCGSNDVQPLRMHLQRDHYLALKRRHSEAAVGDQAETGEDQPPISAQRTDNNQYRQLPPRPPPSPPGVRVGLRPQPEETIQYTGCSYM